MHVPGEMVSCCNAGTIRTVCSRLSERSRSLPDVLLGLTGVLGMKCREYTSCLGLVLMAALLGCSNNSTSSSGTPSVPPSSNGTSGQPSNTETANSTPSTPVPANPASINLQSPPKAIALCIGLNSVNPANYGGWSGPLAGCEPDARDMSAIATNAGFTTKVLLTNQATRSSVLNELAQAAQQLKSGDILMVSYSGHGGFVPDGNGDEPDSYDETWCLFDGELLDDELYGAWQKFAPQVRILVFSDSCHSGTVSRVRPDDFAAPLTMDRAMAIEADFNRAASSGDDAPIPKAMPPRIAIETYQANKAFYDQIGRDAPAERSAPLQATVLLISACADSQTAGDGTNNGIFTGALKRVWDNGAYQSGYVPFQQAVKQRAKQVNSGQDSQYSVVDASWPQFEAQRPFTVARP